MKLLLSFLSLIAIAQASSAQDVEYTPFHFENQPEWHEAYLGIGYGYDFWFNKAVLIDSIALIP